MECRGPWCLALRNPFNQPVTIPSPCGASPRCRRGRQPGRWVISHVRWSIVVLKNSFPLWCYRALKEVKISIKWKLFVNLSFWHKFEIDLQKNCNSSTKFLCGVLGSGGHNPLLSKHFFLCSLDPRPGRWKPIGLSPPSLTLSLSFFKHFLSFWHQRMFLTHLETSVQVLELVLSLRCLGCFYWRRACRNQGLTRCVHCHWGVIASGLRKGIHVRVYMVMSVCMTYTHNMLHT